MARSIWKRTLVTTFAWAGLAWAQQPIASSNPRALPAQNTAQSFTVQEPGKVGQKCTVLKTWKTGDGKTAYQVQAVNTGEMMTIVESGPVTNLPSSSGSQVHAVATRIFHWGSDMKPPAGIPVPPPIEYMSSMPSVPPARPEATKVMSAAQPELAKPPAMPRPFDHPTAPWQETMPQRATAMAQVEPMNQPEPAKPGFFSRLFFRSKESRAPQTQVSVPQDYTFNQAAMTQPGAATQNPTMIPGNGMTSPSIGMTSPSIMDHRVGSPGAMAPPQSSGGSSSVTQPKTAMPDSRFSSTPITQPKTTFQDSWTTQFRPMAQDKASSAYPTNPVATSPAAPQGTMAPPRVVQVVPPGNGGTSSTLTTKSPAPASSAPSSSGQAKPLSAPTSSMTTTAPVKPAPTTGTDAKSSWPGTTAWPPPASQIPAAPVYKSLISSPAPATGTDSKSIVPSTAPVKGAVGNGADVKSVPSGSSAWPTPAPAVPVTPGYQSSTGYPTTSPYSAKVPLPATTAGSKAPATSTPVWPTSSAQTGMSTTPMRSDPAKSTTMTIPPSASTTAPKPAPITAAPPSDWRKSWGKADDSKPQTTDKPAQTSFDSQPASAKPVLPHADSKRPDPLQMPQQFNRRPVEEKPSAPKRDTMLSTAPAAGSTPMVKPAMTSVAEPTKAQSPAGTMSVPPSAQSIPDARRTPLPAITTPVQGNSTSRVVPAASTTSMTSTLAPAPSRQVVSQTASAFSPVSSAVPAASSTQPMAATAPAGMVHAAPVAGHNIPTNSSVISAGFQGPALSNPGAPAAYQTMSSKPTPENLQQMVVALRESLYPSQRELAAQSMAGVDWRAHPQTVQALTTAAKEDPAGTVRAACIRCLANMKANTPSVVAMVRGLKSDADPRVRQEAERALAVLAVGEK